MRALYSALFYTVFTLALGGCGLGFTTGDGFSNSDPAFKLTAGVSVTPRWTSAQVSWSPIAGASRYLVVRSPGEITWNPSNGTSYSLGQGISSISIAYDGDQTNFVDTALTNGQTYYYAVFPYDVASHTYRDGLSGSGVAGPYHQGRYGGFAWQIALGSGRAYLTVGGAIHAFDISTPASPVFLGSYSDSYSAGNLFVDGTTVYLAGSGGIEIVDFSNAATPVLRGRLSTPATAQSVYEADGIAYIADGASGLLIADVSTPSAPRLLGSHAVTNAMVVQVRSGIAYVADQGHGIQTYDVSDPTNPTLLGTATFPSDFSQGIALSGSYAYVADYNSKLRVIDISNPSSPTLVGTGTALGCGFGVAVSGSYAYLAADTGGLNVFDVSTPSSPTRVGVLATSMAFKNVVVSGNNAFIADVLDGLVVANIATPASPAKIGGNDTASQNMSMAAYGDYLLTGGSDFAVFDMSSGAPVQVGRSNSVSFAEAITVSGNRAFLVGTGGLEIMSIATPSAPSSLGTYNTGITWGFDVYVKGTFAYVADPFSGLHVLDVSAPASISEATSIAGSFEYLTGIGNYLYVADSPLRVIDITTPASASQVASAGFNAITVTSGNGYLYVSSILGLQVYDVSNPLAPALVGSVAAIPPSRLYYSAGYVYAAAVQGGKTYAQVYDVSVPSAPKLVANVLSEIGFQSLTALNGKLIIGDAFAGMDVIGPVPAP